MKNILADLKKAVAVGLTVTICLGQPIPASWAGDINNGLTNGILNPQGTPSIHIEDDSEKVKNETSEQNLESPHDAFFDESPLSEVETEKVETEKPEVRLPEETVKKETVKTFDENGNLIEEAQPDGSKIVYHYMEESGHSVLSGISFVDPKGDSVKVEFEIEGLDVTAAREIAAAVMDLMQKNEVQDGSVIYLSNYRNAEAPGSVLLTLRNDNNFYRYQVDEDHEGVSEVSTYTAKLISKETTEEYVTRHFTEAMSFLDQLWSGDRLTIQDAQKMRRIQARLKRYIETFPEDQRPAWVEKFNQYLDLSDRIVATKPLAVVLSDGREILVRNHTDLFTKIIQRFKMMDQTGIIDLSRLAGIDAADLEGLETLEQYFASRRIGSNMNLPSFDLYSPYGNLELMDRLVRKYAAENITEVQGPVEVVVDDFLRFIDGTKPAFDQAIALAKTIFANYPVQIPSGPWTMESIVKVLRELAALNHHLSRDISEQLALFRGEEVFKNQLISEVSNALAGWDGVNRGISYSNIWSQLTRAFASQGIVYQINGKDVRVSAAELDSFVNYLPWDSANLYRYPGVKAGIDPSFLGRLISQNYYQRLSFINLGNSDIPDMTGTNANSFSYVAQRFQLLQEFLKTWPEIIKTDGSVDFDRLRFRLLISQELELALGRAEEYLNGKIQEVNAFGKDGAITAEDYAAMKNLLQSVQEELAKRFDPLLKDVIYSTTNEVTARIQVRFQELVNSFSSVLEKSNIEVTLPDGTSIVFDPRTVQSQVLNRILEAIAIPLNGRFTREAYLRMKGISENMLARLISPEKFNNLKYFNFYHYQSDWQSPNFANEEILFVLIPEIVQNSGTADVHDLSALMTEGIALPVPLGEVLETVIKNQVTGLHQNAINAMNSITPRTLADVLKLKDIFQKLISDLRQQVGARTGNLSAGEISSLETWINWNWNSASSLSHVSNVFNAKIAGIDFLEVDGVRVPVRQILAIPGFPFSRDFNRELFPGLQAGDFENAESGSEASSYQYFRFVSTGNNPPDSSLSALGRIEVVVNAVSRWIKSLDSSSKVFFINKEGKREIDPNEFRKLIKGVYAMQAAVLEQTRLLADAAAEELESLRKGHYTIQEIEAMHNKVLALRDALIKMLTDKASIHERQDVLAVENEVSLVYQEKVFDLFVSIVGKAKLTIEIDGQTVNVPAKAITEILIAYLKTQVEGSLAAHHFAALFGISVDDIRKLHKLENYFSEQIVALPKNSEYVQIISQISELGYMQLAVELVKRYAQQVVKDGQVDVDLLIQLAADKEGAVSHITQSAREILAGKIKELRDAAGQRMSFEALTQMVKIMEDAKGQWVSMMNDFLSGNSDEALLKELEDLVNALYGELKADRDDILEHTPFIYEVGGKEISLYLNRETVSRFADFISGWLAANPGAIKPPDSEKPVYDDYLVYGLFDDGQISLTTNKSMVNYYPRIWLPYPDPRNYNPGDHPTSFGLAVLLARLAVKYAEFAVDENGFNVELFLKELQASDQSRAERRLQSLIDNELPGLKDFIESLRGQDRALPVEKIGKINEKFAAFKKKIQALGNDSQAKAQEVWGKFMELYEASLFEGKLSADIDGKTITFEPKVLNDILMKLYQENKLDPALMAKFGEMVAQGESQWQYDNFKTLPYYRIWGRRGYDDLMYDIQMVQDEKIGSLIQEGSFTSGDLARLPGISAKDLYGLDVQEKDSRLRLTPVDPVTLLGLLDMRALAPGSGVNSGGLMTAMSMSETRSQTNALMPYDIGIVLDDRYIVIGKKVTSNLQSKSFRFVAFEFIPALLKEFGDKVIAEGKVISEYFGLALEGKLERETPEIRFREAIAKYLGVKPEDVLRVNYDQYFQSREDGQLVCQGSGCDVIKGYLDVSASVNGKEKHFSGKITLDVLAAPEIFLLETDAQINGRALAAIADAIGFRMEDLLKVAFTAGTVCLAEGCPQWAGDLKVEAKEFLAVAPIRYFEGSIAQISPQTYKINLTEVKTSEMRMREVVFADLVKSFGFTDQILKDLVKRGLVKIEVDLKTLKAVVTIDPSVKVKEGMLNLVNPLGGNGLPKEIVYQLYQTNIMCMGPDCLPIGIYLSSASFRIGVDSFELTYTNIWIRGTLSDFHTNLLSSVAMHRDGKKIMNIAYTYNFSDRIQLISLIKPIPLYEEEPIAAHIVYYNGSQEAVASRNVEMRRMQDGQYHIQSVTDYDQDGKVIAQSQFQYVTTLLGDCPVDDKNCPSGILVHLNSITRTGADGKPLSKITNITIFPTKAREGIVVFEATVVLPNGREKRVTFQTFEELLRQALKIEHMPDPVRKTVRVQAEQRLFKSPSVGTMFSPAFVSSRQDNEDEAERKKRYWRKVFSRKVRAAKK